MFIKRIEKKNNDSNKVYVYFRLMESYRTQSGPRQRKILDLGKLNSIDLKDHKELADLIEDELNGVERLFSTKRHLKELAKYFASLIIKDNLVKKEDNIPEERESKKEPSYIEVDESSIVALNTKTIGAEYVGLSMLKELGLDNYLSTLGFSKDHIDLSILSIMSRLIYPSSEHATKYWAQNISALDVLLSTSFEHISQNALYRISDKLFSYKDQIEDYLSQKQKDLFSLKETLILYDLTNTYFEGLGKAQKLSFGYSKEKRYDCPLITLGLVIDNLGFVKHTQIFEGNVSEPKTLVSILDFLSSYSVERPTIAIDAGIASEDNIELIKQKGFDYICVARNKNTFKDLLFQEEKVLDDQTTISLCKVQEEAILFVQSKGRQKKEEAMKSKAKEAFEKNLKTIVEHIKQNKHPKKYDKVLEQISRLKEKHSLVSRFYTIDIKQEDNLVKSIDYSLEEEKINKRFNGSCYIRTSRTDLDEGQIKDLYSMLTRVEESFRNLKSELGLRPNFHQKEDCIEPHIFITTLAYHMLNTIIYKLRSKDIHYSWNTVRTILSTYTLNTIALKTRNNKQIYISSCTQLQPLQKQIYEALEINPLPVARKSISK